MEVSAFTEEVHHLVEKLNTHLRKKRKKFSDIIDDDGHQYVDIVMEGGGVLGIALVGFTYVLERANIRFLQIGGASAGAINALLLAGLGTPVEAKSEKILHELANVDMFSFVDGDDDARSVVEAWLDFGDGFASDKENKSFFNNMLNKPGKYYFYAQLAQVWDNVRDDLGLNPGDVFKEWIKDILGAQGIFTNLDLQKQLDQLPASLHHRDAKQSLKGRTGGLALVAADVSTQTKAIFPKMAELYWKDPDNVNPADFVRASMSIPVFFKPFRVENIPRGKKAMGCWKKFAGYEESLPTSCVFIDGGIMSNFPINLFHRPDRAPTAPTFGVKLGVDEKKTENITSIFTLASVIFDTARFNLDTDFIARNPDYRMLVSCINTGDINWLDFRMSDKDKLTLFKSGAEAADKFLREFDWEDYKKVRQGLVDMSNAANYPKEIMQGDAVPTAIKGV